MWSMLTQLILPVAVFALAAIFPEPVAKALEKANAEHPVTQRYALTSEQQHLRPLFVRAFALVASAALCVTWFVRS